MSVVRSMPLRSLSVYATRKRSASPGQLIYGVTHEFRPVLGSIPFMIARAGSITDLERSLSGGWAWPAPILEMVQANVGIRGRTVSFPIVMWAGIAQRPGCSHEIDIIPPA